TAIAAGGRTDERAKIVSRWLIRGTRTFESLPQKSPRNSLHRDRNGVHQWFDRAVLAEPTRTGGHYHEMSSNSRTTSRENGLGRERSPYLLQHKHNPVDWWPWGTEALEEAKRSNKPVLLSVGYAACHWCHVMAHESFEDTATAKVMNDLFVNIKVDREERP